jgi:uncharacterized protein YndB with AHSA1/START domain
VAEPPITLEAKQSVFVRAPCEKVYDAFATAEGLDGWFTRGSQIDARPGGALLFRWVDWGAEREITADVPGRVMEAKRPERLVFEWGVALTLAKFWLEHGIATNTRQGAT